MRILVIIASLLLSCSLLAKEDEKAAFPSYIPRVIDPTFGEKALNFGLVYSAQWTYYLIAQKEVIEDEGSFHNWTNNPFKPHFDKDNFDYNLFKHAVTGNYYYLFYRSRGYDIQDSFIWSFVSSLAFEFTVETITEKPSYQDIYQTPVFGTVIGVGVEKLSRYFHSKDSWWGHTLGYVLNPFTLIPAWERNEVVATPVIKDNTIGAAVSFRY